MADFQTFGTATPAEASLTRAKELAVKFVADIQSNPWGQGRVLTLAGKSGSGKTLLAQMILNELGYRGGICWRIPQQVTPRHVRSFDAGFWYWPKVSGWFKDWDYSAVDGVIEQRLSVLDDIGADHDPKRIASEKCMRMLREHRGWMVVTVNMGLQEISAQMDVRIASFLMRDENIFHEIQAEDFAKRKFKQINSNYETKR